MRETIKKIVWRLLELGFLVAAFALLVPPVPSEIDETYPLFPGLGIAAVLFACNQTLASWRGVEHWTVALLKILLFMGLGWLIHERVWM